MKIILSVFLVMATTQLYAMEDHSVISSVDPIITAINNNNIDLCKSSIGPNVNRTLKLQDDQLWIVFKSDEIQAINITKIIDNNHVENQCTNYLKKVTQDCIDFNVFFQNKGLTQLELYKWYYIICNIEINLNININFKEEITKPELLYLDKNRFIFLMLNFGKYSNEKSENINDFLSTLIFFVNMIYDSIASSEINSDINNEILLKIKNNFHLLDNFDKMHDTQYSRLGKMLHFNSFQQEVDNNFIQWIAQDDLLFSLRLPILKILLQNGINLNSIIIKDLSLLIICAMQGDVECCKFLLENGADPNFKDKIFGKNSLLWALTYPGRPEEIIETLLPYYNNSPMHNTKDGQSAMHLAITRFKRKGRAAFILLKNNFYNELEDISGKDVLEEALSSDSYYTGEKKRKCLLLKIQIADTLLEKWKNVKRKHLILALKTNNINLIKKILDKGIILEYKDLEHVFVKNTLNDSNTYYQFLDFCFKNYKGENRNFFITQIYYFELFDMQILNLLIKYGFNINSKDYSRRTPLQYAINCHNIKMITFLIKNGACIPKDPSANELPFINKIRKKFDGLVDLIVANDVESVTDLILEEPLLINLSYYDDNDEAIGNTPLDFAINSSGNNQEMLQILAFLGAHTAEWRKANHVNLKNKKYSDLSTQCIKSLLKLPKEQRAEIILKFAQTNNAQNLLEHFPILTTGLEIDYIDEITIPSTFDEALGLWK